MLLIQYSIRYKRIINASNILLEIQTYAENIKLKPVHNLDMEWNIFRM